MNTKSKSWGNLSKAKVLIIGHDPRLKKSNTIADYCFFANYIEKYKNEEPTTESERRKFIFAKSLYSYVNDLTNNKYLNEDFYFTNLCNNALPHPKTGNQVYIPENEAITGLAEIKNILTNTNIKIILSMSLQVNYWLQKLGFYKTTMDFMENAKPKLALSKLGCYEANAPKSYPFLDICGKMYKTSCDTYLFPILHIIQINGEDIGVYKCTGRYQEKLYMCKTLLSQL